MTVLSGLKSKTEHCQFLLLPHITMNPFRVEYITPPYFDVVRIWNLISIVFLLAYVRGYAKQNGALIAYT